MLTPRKEYACWRGVKKMSHFFPGKSIFFKLPFSTIMSHYL